jgi:glycosyltransferase involved in cell wall biosynthesis
MTENIHILHIETGRHLYGGALQVFHLMKGLAENGCRNTIVCPSGSDIAKAETPGVHTWAVPIRGELDALFMLRLCRIISRLQPDIVHVHSRRGADIWGAAAAWCTHTPAVITRRVDNPESPFIARLKYRIYSRVVAISEGIRHVLLSEGVPAEKIACIPSAVDARRFAVPCDREWFLREFDLKPSHRAIGMIAQFIPRKGHRFLIAAAPDILTRCPEARFILFGKGPLEEDLRQQCKRNRVADRTIFAGFRHDLERILSCLDVVVHPATLEGLGVSLLQTAAAGVPIVATRAGGIPEIVAHGTNGYLIDSGDIRAIMSRVTDLLANPAKSARFGAAGQMMVKSRFSIGAMVKGNLAVYRKVLSEQVPAGRIGS